MTLQDRKCGHNVIHLILPLKEKKRFASVGNRWRELLNGKSDQTAGDYYRSDVNRIDLISDRQVMTYIHPSLHNTLFRLGSRSGGSRSTGLRSYRLRLDEAQSNKFYAFLRDGGGEIRNAVRFEMLALELALFDNTHFLVVRLSMNENVRVGLTAAGPDALTVVESAAEKAGDLHTVALWAQFANRIRFVYKKYPAQADLRIHPAADGGIVRPSDMTGMLDGVKSLLDDWFFDHFVISARSIDAPREGEDTPYEERLEPVAFTHGFVAKVDESEADADWTRDELYQICCIDDYSGESGGTASFRERFLERHVYERWANAQSYMTAVDYGTMMLARVTEEQYFASTDFVRGVLYQNHCKHYLLFVLLQLYYREELQEIMGDYARTQDIRSNRKEAEVAKRVLRRAVHINQYFVFDRLTNEIQGQELWRFYQSVFDTERMLGIVRQDMQELNQRLNEYENERQSGKLTMLTVFAGLTGLLGMNRMIAAGEHLPKGLSDYSAEYDMFLQMLASALLVALLAYSGSMIVGMVMGSRGRVRKAAIVLGYAVLAGIVYGLFRG